MTETVGAAPADTLRSFGHSEEIRLEDEIARRPPLGRLIRALPDLTRLAANTLRAGRVFRDHQAHTERILARLATDPRDVSDRDIVATFDWVTRAAIDPRDGPGLRAIVSRRATQLEAERDLQLPLLMRESELPTLLAASRQDDRDTGDSPVSASAPVRLTRRSS